MLARRGLLNHPSGVTIELPLLIPSFTSKGFPRKKALNSNKQYAESSWALTNFGPLIDTAMLISAFDIYHRTFYRPTTAFGNQQIIFVDSGGYELSTEFDPTEPVHVTTVRDTSTKDSADEEEKEFSEAQYRTVLDKLPSKSTYVITSFDWGTKRQEITTQIRHARKLFNEYPMHLHNFLVKLGKKRKYVNMDTLVANVKQLKQFHVLGITEKELGKNLIDKLLNLAKLRVAMDREKVHIPIHVYGGLDPTITPLYFLAGASAAAR